MDKIIAHYTVYNDICAVFRAVIQHCIMFMYTGYSKLYVKNIKTNREELNKQILNNKC